MEPECIYCGEKDCSCVCKKITEVWCLLNREDRRKIFKSQSVVKWLESKERGKR